MVPSGYVRDQAIRLEEDSDEDLSFLDAGPSAAQYLQTKRQRVEPIGQNAIHSGPSNVTPVRNSTYEGHRPNLQKILFPMLGTALPE